jgi:hypothetical protein
VDGGQPVPRAASLTHWLRGRDDRQLARLFRLRPDLALPAPADLAALAGRVAVRTSTQRAVDNLDAYTLRALENLVLAADDTDAVDAPPGDALDTLLDLALVWGDADLVHLTPNVRESVGPYPAGLGRPAASLLLHVPDIQLVPVLRNLGLPPSPQPRAGGAVAAVLADRERLTALVDASDPGELEVLDRLAAGPPVGTVRNTRLVGADAELSAAHRLINRGLLVPLDSQRVELPREIGTLLRERASAGTSADPPEIATVSREPVELDRLGTTAVLEFLRQVDALADEWTARPPALLRSGGLGVRELRRTARALGVEEPAAALVAEVAYAAGLLNSTNGPEPVFLPTAEFDHWQRRDTAPRWIALAAAWLAMTRQPSLVNQRGERDRVITALGPDAERGTIPALRRHVLDLLTELPPGAAPADRGDVLARFAWQQPRRASGQVPLVEAILAEADLLGATAAGGLTGYTRTLLAGATGGPDAVRTSAAAELARTATAAEHALARALPDPVDHFLVQPDLTIVVPGPPEPALAGELALLPTSSRPAGRTSTGSPSGRSAVRSTPAARANSWPHSSTSAPARRCRRRCAT